MVLAKIAKISLHEAAKEVLIGEKRTRGLQKAILPPRMIRGRQEAAWGSVVAVEEAEEATLLEEVVVASIVEQEAAVRGTMIEEAAVTEREYK